MTEGVVPKTEKAPAVQFGEQLNSILYTPLSVENIGRFADDALNELITLNESVIHKYQQEYPESDAYIGRDLEDAAYAAYGLENLGSVLDRITAVRDRIAEIAQRVQESLSQTNSVIVPPDETGPAFGNIGSGTYEAPDKLNRLITLAYILETDFDLDQDKVRYTQGITTDTMVRQEPYVRVEIDGLKRVVYVCDEEGNASYVFDTKVLEALGIDILSLDKMTKNGRNAFLRKLPEAGRRIVQSPAWRIVVSQALREPFIGDGKVPVPTETAPRSEFIERGRFLEFSDFEAEAKAAYEKANKPEGVAKWYKSEYKKHSGWPSSPETIYQDKGWEGYLVLIGQEVVDFLNFTIFTTEVRDAYKKAGISESIVDWYKSEYKKHSGWPSSPHHSYKDAGWKGYPALVGQEVVKFFTFTDFVKDVNKVFKAAGSPTNVRTWYAEEQKQHDRWPFSPQNTYEENGWQSYPELVGRERVEFLDFVDFVVEVQTAYKTAGQPSDIAKWYEEVYKTKKGWPSNPTLSYKDAGWKGYPALIGQEVVEFLSYATFEAEVKAAYKVAGSPSAIANWYREEYKKHARWPSSPLQAYKDAGWKGYQALIGQEVVEFLSYATFETQLIATYKAAGTPSGMQRWYNQIYKNHPGWPSNPQLTYKDQGWRGYATITGKI